MQIRQIAIGSIPEKYYPFMDKTAAICSGLDYDVLEYPDIESGSALARCIESNNRRLDLAMQMPDLLYLDLDIELMKIPQFSGDKPHFAYYHGQPEASMFYVNGQTNFFKSLLEEANRRGISTALYSWQMKVLRDKDVVKISAECYTHHHASLSVCLRDSGARKKQLKGALYG